MRLNTGTACHQDHFTHLVRAQVPMVKMDVLGDPRLIPLGALLRATGLDELPQIFNVLRGEMSVVGPRPCTPYEYDHFYEASHRPRFHALPGLTGLWQVSGKNKTTFNEMIALDIQYARTQSPALDFKIILKTFPVLLAQTVDALRRRFSEPARLQRAGLEESQQ